MIKGIIFDFGGTLDTGGNHWSQVIREGWNRAGIAADVALFREAYVYGEQELERTLPILPHHKLGDLLNIKIQIELGYLASSGNFPPQLIEEKASEIADYCYGVAKTNIEKAKPVLEELSGKYPIAIVSNFYGNLETVLAELGLQTYFKKVIDSEKVGLRKPDKKIFELGIKALDMKPEEVLVVGDSVKNDMEPAKELGCKTLLLEGKGWEDSPLENNFDSIKQLDEILKYLAN